jgi:hypothetical protein
MDRNAGIQRTTLFNYLKPFTDVAPDRAIIREA